MRIRNKILIYFSLSSIVLIGLTFLLIYSLFASYRKEQFQERIKEQTKSTTQFLIEAKMMNEAMLQSMDEFVINNFFKEKILIFDAKKEMIYASVDDTKIYFQQDILNQLSSEHPEVELTDGQYDVVGIYFQFDDQYFYGLGKAIDKSGFEKLIFLKYTLLTIFVFISSIILVISYWLSKQITLPLNKMTHEMVNISLDSNQRLINVPSTNDEIEVLATQFNELMLQLFESYEYQKHAIHHLSHELKTPLAVLVSNFDKLAKETEIDKLQNKLQIQKENTKNLSEIINALLEISKIDSGLTLDTQEVQIDDLIFDIISELNILDENFRFEVEIGPSILNDSNLKIWTNYKLLRIAIVNLAENARNYSSTPTAKIHLSMRDDTLIIEFINQGTLLNNEEKGYMFNHFFRGENSKGKKGFGLGLVMVSKIMKHLGFEIFYSVSSSNENVFSIRLQSLNKPLN